jgi:4-amino-4-deoxy-L-arabinose transferase-like glycosyltransferase
MVVFQRVYQPVALPTSTRLERLSLLILVPIIGFLTLANLATYPTMSGWDEGAYLQMSRNLARYGEYATRNGDVYERLTPAGGTGPTLIVPVALALQLGGDRLLAARSVAVIYALIAIIGVYLLLRQIAGWPAAVVGVLLFVVAGDSTSDMLWAFRQVLAEAPAFAFIMFGMWAWVKSWQGSRGWLIASGILIALAVVTKNQFLWLLGPGFALVTIVDRLYYRRLSWIHGLVPVGGAIVGYGSWFLLSLWIVGPVARPAYLEALWALATATGANGDLERWFHSVKVFFKNPQSAIAVVAIAYGLYSSRERSSRGLTRLMLSVFAAVGVLEFFAMAIPYPRYLYAPLGFALMCGALLIDDLACWVASRWHSSMPLRAIVIGLLVVLIAGPRIMQHIQRILTTNDTSAERFAAVLDEMVPAGSKVMTWEWEVEFFSQSKFVHPPNRLFPAMLDALDERIDPIIYQPRVPPDVKYLVIGPFGYWVFESALKQRPYRLLTNIGEYHLYQFLDE